MPRPSEKTMRRSAVLAALLAPFAMYDYARTGFVNEIWLYTTCGLVGSIGIVVGVRLHRSPHAWGWYLIALGNLSFVVGDLVYFYIGDPPFPGLPDVFYLAGYPLMAWGLGRLVREKGRGRGNIIDASIVATSAALIGWVFLMEPYASDPSLTIGAKLVSVAYPLGDLALLAATCWLLLSGVRRNPSLRWLMVSMAALLVADIVYAVTVLEGTYNGGWVDAGYLLAYMTLASAALHPSMRLLDPPLSKAVPTLSRRRLGLLAAGAIIGPGLLAVSASRGVEVDLPVLAAGSIVLFLLALMRIAGLMRAVERNASLLDEQRNRLGDALTELRTIERDRHRLLEAILATSEQERSALASDLHDGPIQQLTALALTVELAAVELEADGPRACFERLEELQQGFSEQISSLRTLMANLRPPVLEERGIVAALEDHVAAFRERTGISVETDIVPVRLERMLETVLYRVAHEALTNVAKHARGSRAEVKLRSQDDGVVLEISDDGIGFEIPRIAQAPKLGHIGLVSMRERVELAGGRWELVSKPDQGTTIKVHFDKIGTENAGFAAASALTH